MSDWKRVKEQFQEPAIALRSVPFWAWNDELEQEELTRQIADMHDKGMGGFFMHSRDGLETPYLGEAWMDAVRTAVEQAGQLGMKAWLYDEDRWPSGTAGGSVPARGDAFRSKGLTLEVASGDYENDGRIAAVFRAVIDGLELIRCERVPIGDRKAEDTMLEEDEVFLVFRVEVSAASEWFNDESPPDSLNPDTIQAFIESTYEVYKAEFGEHFGKTIAGVFTDEPSVHDRHSRYTPGRGWVPWTYSFPDYFAGKRGYDPLDTVPYLFFDGKLSPMARHDYWRTVSDKFCDAYSRQLGEWCEANGLAFTGHYLWESALGVATRVAGSLMPHYRYQHVPGIDMLSEQTDEQLTVKQCTSVANQYGRPYVISETYGCAGWEFTFEGQKWMGDWQYVLGVNLRSQHLTMYSIKGCRKRDYPPFFGYQTSWWKYNRLMEDYFARIASVTTEGRPIRDILVLHPASTAWSLLGTNPYGSTARGKDRNIPEINDYGDSFNAFLRTLLGAHYDFDLGDETIMAEAGDVRGGKLHVQLASYETVVVPPIRTMLRSTFELLLRFADAGGNIVLMTPWATMLEGRAVPEEELERLYGHPRVIAAVRAEEAVRELERIHPRTVSIRNRYGTEQPELFYLLKAADGFHSLFVVNNDRKQSYDVFIETDQVGRVEELNPLTGTITAVKAEIVNGRLRFYTSFKQADSKLYVILPMEDVTETVAAEALVVERRPVTAAQWAQTLGSGWPYVPAANGDKLSAAFGPSFRFSRTQPNVLTLDRCSYKLGADAAAAGHTGHAAGWSSEMDIWRAQREIREKLSMRQVYYNGITQRYKWIHQPHHGNDTPIALKLIFQVAEVPVGGLQLVLEGSRQFRIHLNGIEQLNEPEGWFVDRSMDCIRLTDIRSGVNELELRCSYHQAMELEDCYLIGAFALDRSRSIAAEPDGLLTGDWCLQGYPHYNGSIVYHADFNYQPEEGRRVLLQLGEWSAVTVEIRVNGETAGHVPWKAADGVDLTSNLQPGANRLDIEVMGSPRNMFGPFHEAEGYTATTSWSSFRQEGSGYTPGYVLQPYGLFSQVKLIGRI
ncbi:glycosyl hydrolase [Paenibacillus sp. NPDC056579]|uniref:glycosyl hydrolase n=1 Tax=Paenibacillus sp. NPDC056579 TaxID=3345871 RepID=UPI0036B85877